ncbi:hypothetical protein HNQ77_000837 [Silvibacterium bohemicum]|uniref:Uncharacterized protein n=1 Tax=Silvibacterium bohemicum TaxID=1577686 RepID=A0A841JNQ3_9BACT|nr:hypothetical protein [Silvibacterium bohemicum]
MLSWRIFFLMAGMNYHFHSIVQTMIAYKCRCANGISMRDEFYTSLHLDLKLV